MEAKPVAAGSIWNPNSWHWEMKNYTDVAKKLVEGKILEMEIREADVVITNTKVRFPKA
jgi:activator of HSP90 ATPase